VLLRMLPLLVLGAVRVRHPVSAVAVDGPAPALPDGERRRPPGAPEADGRTEVSVG